MMVCDGIEAASHEKVYALNETVLYTGKLRYAVVDKKRERLVEVDWPKDVDWTNGMQPVEPEK